MDAREHATTPRHDHAESAASLSRPQGLPTWAPSNGLVASQFGGGNPPPGEFVAEMAAVAGNQAVGRLLSRATSTTGSDATTSQPQPSSDEVPNGFVERLNSVGGGSPIPQPARERLEAGLGAPVADVRVHTGPESSALADQVGARAFTVGNEVHFGAGEYDASSSDGYQLLAHEVVHTLQQDGGSANGPLAVSAPNSAVERQADQVANHLAADRAIRPGDAAARGAVPDPVALTRAPRMVGREPTSTAGGPATADAGTPSTPDAFAAGPADAASGGAVKGLDPALSASLSAEDRQALATAFPGGVTAGPATPMIVGMQFGMRLDGFRVPVIRLTPVAEVPRGIETYLMEVGKGRAVLVSSIGGGSVLFDAGTGQTTSINAASVQRLVRAIGAVTAGGVAVPSMIKLSHADTDHYNAVRALLSQAAFSNTAVEVVTQQMGRASGGSWTASSLTVHETQRLVQLDVMGGPVHIQVSVVDNLEMTEFRLVTAAQELAEPGRQTFNRNRSCPVVVVHDLISGERMVLTADGEGGPIARIINAVGPVAFSRVLGGEAHNLKAVEGAHHYGKQAGADATGMLNMLRLAYEAGEGSVRLFAQTTRSFATDESRNIRSFNFLESVGLAPEMIEDDPSGSGQAQVTRLRGDTMQRLTIDMAGVQRAAETIEAGHTHLRAAYDKLAEIDGLRAQAAAMRAALASGAPAPLTASIEATDADLARVQTALRSAANEVWSRADAAATAAGSLSRNANLVPVTQALEQLGETVRAGEPDLTRSANDMSAHVRGLSLYGRLYSNAIRMIAALQAENIAELYALRAEHTDIVRAVAGALGPAEVHAHVRSAWAAVRAAWPPEIVEQATSDTARRLAMRQMSLEFRTQLSETLMRQMQLTDLAAEAERGGRTVYGPGGTIITPVSTRVQAGILAMLELIRIGLEIAVQVKEAGEAADARNLAASREGIATVSWWQANGVKPTIALVKRGSWSGWNVVSNDQGVAWQAVTSSEPPAGAPEFDMVVVTDVDPATLHAMVQRLVARLSALGDWASFVAGYPPGPVIRRFGSDWGILLWNTSEEEYRYVRLDENVAMELDRLHTALEAGQEARLAGESGGPSATVRDGAWLFGSNRKVMVYDRRGFITTVDFGAQQPAFVQQGTIEYPIGAAGPLVRVRAADAATFRRLCEWYWVKSTNQTYLDQSGIHKQLAIEANAEGLAYVYADQLEPVPAGGTAAVGSGR